MTAAPDLTPTERERLAAALRGESHTPEGAEACEHAWRFYAHMDACHWYSYAYACDKCGSTRVDRSERRIDGDGYALVHMDPESCDRCRELVEAR